MPLESGKSNCLRKVSFLRKGGLNRHVILLHARKPLKNAILQLVQGVIHIPRGQIFGNFDPLPPPWSNVVIWPTPL